MTPLAVFGIGMIEMMIILSCVGVMGVLVIGTIVAILAANGSRHDRQE